MTEMATSGLALKLQRVAQDVKAIDLAARMGVANSTVSRIESSRIVSDKLAQKYRAALATFPTVANDATSSSVGSAA